MQPTAFPTWGTENSDSGSFLGRKGQYTGVAGKPAIYQKTDGGMTTVSLRRIQAFRKQSGAWEPISGGYSILMADAESTDPSGEYIAFETTGQDFEIIPNRPKSSDTDGDFRWGNSCGGSATFVGKKWPTATAGETGREAACHAGASGAKTGTMMLETAAPADGSEWSVTQTMKGSGLQGVAFAVMTRGVEVQSQIGSSHSAVGDDAFQTVIVREERDGDKNPTSRTVVASSEVVTSGGSGTYLDYSEIRGDEEIRYYVGQRVAGASPAGEDSSHVTDYQRTWSSLKDTTAAGSDQQGCLDIYTGQTLPITETQLNDTIGVSGLPDGTTTTDYVFAGFDVPVRHTVSCRITNIPHTVQVGNRVTLQSDTPDADKLEPTAWINTRAADGATTVTSFDGQKVVDEGGRTRAVLSRTIVSVRPGDHAFGAATTNAKGARYNQGAWEYSDASGGSLAQFASGPLGETLTLPTFDIGTHTGADAVPARAVRAYSHFTYGYGAAEWTKVAEGDADQKPLAGSEWVLLRIQPAEGGEEEVPMGAVKDCVASDKAACATSDISDGELRDLDPAAGKFQVDHLPFGSYVLQETRAPEGFLLDTTARYEFLSDGGQAPDDRLVIAVHGQTIRQAVENRKLNPQTSQLGIRKDTLTATGGTDSMGVPGIGYAIFADPADTDPVIGGLTTTGKSDGGIVRFRPQIPAPSEDEDGAARAMELNRTYYLREVNAPSGHQLLPADVPFQLRLPHRGDERPVSDNPYVVLVDADGTPLDGSQDHLVSTAVLPDDPAGEEPGSQFDRLIVVSNVKAVTLPVAGGSGPGPVRAMGTLVLLASAGAWAGTCRRPRGRHAA